MHEMFVAALSDSPGILYNAATAPNSPPARAGPTGTPLIPAAPAVEADCNPDVGLAAEAASTTNPYVELVTVLPAESVVVTWPVAVVLAVHPLQEVHGGLVPQGPEVQPLHVDGGHAPED